ncbi:unnamed protein product [Urochloa humidicola]
MATEELTEEMCAMILVKLEEIGKKMDERIRKLEVHSGSCIEAPSSSSPSSGKPMASSSTASTSSLTSPPPQDVVLVVPSATMEIPQAAPTRCSMAGPNRDARVPVTADSSSASPTASPTSSPPPGAADVIHMATPELPPPTPTRCLMMGPHETACVLVPAAISLASPTAPSVPTLPQEVVVADPLTITKHRGDALQEADIAVPFINNNPGMTEKCYCMFDIPLYAFRSPPWPPWVFTKVLKAWVVSVSPLLLLRPPDAYDLLVGRIVQVNPMQVELKPWPPPKPWGIIVAVAELRPAPWPSFNFSQQGVFLHLKAPWPPPTWMCFTRARVTQGAVRKFAQYIVHLYYLLKDMVSEGYTKFNCSGDDHVYLLDQLKLLQQKHKVTHLASRFWVFQIQPLSWRVNSEGHCFELSLPPPMQLKITYKGVDLWLSPWLFFYSEAEAEYLKLLMLLMSSVGSPDVPLVGLELIADADSNCCVLWEITLWLLLEGETNALSAYEMWYSGWVKFYWQPILSLLPHTVDEVQRYYLKLLDGSYRDDRLTFNLLVISTKLEQHLWSLQDQLPYEQSSYEGRAWLIELACLESLAGSSAKELKHVTFTRLRFESYCKAGEQVLQIKDGVQWSALVQVATFQSICKYGHGLLMSRVMDSAAKLQLLQ